MTRGRLIAIAILFCLIALIVYAKYKEVQNRRVDLLNKLLPLRVKTVQEVRRLVDNWNNKAIPEMIVNGNPEDSVSNFYKIFGVPERNQYLGAFNSYCLYYECEDGYVQLEVDADKFGKENEVCIKDLNIF